MRLLRNFRQASLLLLVVSLLAPHAPAQTQPLGRVEFPATTSSEEARTHFLRGVAALHSFWYEEALAEFRAATAADPGFVMGYWGEAMARNHPLWGEQETEAARRALEKVKDTSRVTARERAFVAAVRALYGVGEKPARDAAYAKAMEKVARDYPADLEAASFYALSLLGTVRPGERGFARQARAAAVALDVYQKNPNHPGAAHYIIHAFDDPEHAVLALPAARRYAEIAPEAHHARHMPAHIFLQLGMWPEAAASNESAWAASEAWVKRRDLSPDLRDYHSLHWLTYVYLQQGRYRQAEELIALMRRAAVAPGSDPERTFTFYPWMAAAYVVETEAWDAVDRLFDVPAPHTTTPAAGRDAGAGAHAAHGGDAQASTPAQPSQAAGRPSLRTRSFRSFELSTRALAQAARGQSVEVDRTLTELRALRREFEERGGISAYRAKGIEVRELEAAALLASVKGKHDEAVGLMKRAVALEEEMSPSAGPPDLVKPSHELFGEILLRAGHHTEAAAQFAAALARQPNRARSLVGAARAAAKAGDRRAAGEAYAAFLRAHSGADESLPELKEARDYLSQTAAR